MHGTPPDPAPAEPRARGAALLTRYGILATANEPAFDAAVRTAGRVFGCPTALVSLLDTDRAWFDAMMAPGTCAALPDASFCGRVVARRAPMVVLDALADPRFRENPLVTGDPGIRFYAGAPIRIGAGPALGTLCVIDDAPRAAVSARQDGVLAHLAVAVGELISDRAELRMMARVGQELARAMPGPGARSDEGAAA